MSRFSPGIVKDEEKLARFVLNPMHVGKSGIKSSVFSHVSTKGCSIQREDVASGAEILELITNFLAKDTRQAWNGVLLASCAAVRAIKIQEGHARMVCVFDTAEKSNPAHAEMCQTHHVVSEADGAELRKKLFEAFGNGVPVTPANYRQGAIWAKLEPKRPQI